MTTIKKDYTALEFCKELVKEEELWLKLWKQKLYFVLAGMFYLCLLNAYLIWIFSGILLGLGLFPAFEVILKVKIKKDKSLMHKKEVELEY